MLRQSHKTILLWVLLILMFVSVYNLFAGQKQAEDKIQFSEFMQKVENEPQTLKHVTIKATGANAAEFSGELADGQKRFQTTGFILDKTIEKLNDKKIPYEVQKENENSFWQSVLISWLPMLFLFLIFVFF